jgi:hypothetical protein
MTKVGFDSNPFGTPACDDPGADMCSPGAGYVTHPMVTRKFIGETAAKVIRLSDIYRIPSPILSLVAEDVDASNGIKCNGPEFEVLKFVRRAADPPPRKPREGVD